MGAAVGASPRRNRSGATPRRCGRSRAIRCPRWCISRTAARGTAGSCCSIPTRTPSRGASTTSSSEPRGRHPSGRRTERHHSCAPRTITTTRRVSWRRSSCTTSPSRHPPRNRATRTASNHETTARMTRRTRTERKPAIQPRTTTAPKPRRSRSSTTRRGRASSAPSSTTWSDSWMSARWPRRAACEASGASDASGLDSHPQQSTRSGVKSNSRMAAWTRTTTTTM